MSNNNELPEVGDLAKIIYAPCCWQHRLGTVIQVTRIMPTIYVLESRDTNCSRCGQPLIHPKSMVCIDDTVPQESCYIVWYPRQWLKKIPPLAVLEETEEEAHA